jgi:hypothetical protein
VINVIDDFLFAELHQQVCKTLLGPDFPWFFNEYVVVDDEEQTINSFQFTHTFYRNHNVCSSHYDALRPIIGKLNPQALVRIKANLIPISKDPVVSKFHVDVGFPCTTAIYYLNTTDGPTVFENGVKVDCVANRLVMFDSRLRHASSRCTDSKRRCVINFNYFTGSMTV